MVGYFYQGNIVEWYFDNFISRSVQLAKGQEAIQKKVSKEERFSRHFNSNFQRQQLEKNILKRSKWLDTERDFYIDNLSKSNYDFLVTPCQVTGGAFDKVTRSLVSMYLADNLIRTGFKVPDVVSVSKALNSTYRTYYDKEVHSLANRLNVKDILICKIGHDDQWGGKIILSRWSLSNKNEFIQVGDEVVDEYKYTKTDLPSEVIYEKLESYFDRLELNITKKVVSGNNSIANAFIPNTYNQILHKDGVTALQAAYNLQFLAQIYPRQSLDFRDRLFERSLVALKYISPKLPDYRLLKARAYFYLHRRPSAMKILAIPTTDQEYAFKNFLEGNLTELVEYTKKLKNSYFSQMSWIELNELYYQYHEKESKEYRSEKHQSVQFSDFISARYIESDQWRDSSNFGLARSFGNNFEGVKISVDNFLKQNSSLQKGFIDAEDIDELLKNNIDAVKGAGVDKRDYPVWGISLDDVINLYQAWMEDNFIGRINKNIALRGLPERALQTIKKLEDTFEGHPYLAYFKGRAYNYLIDSSKKEKQVDLHRKYREQMFFSYMWSDGQTYMAEDSTRIKGDIRVRVSLDKLLDPDKQRLYNRAQRLFTKDYPRRWYWKYDRQSVQNMSFSIDELSNHHFDGYMRNVENLIKFNANTELAAIMDKYKNRFHGHPKLAFLKVTALASQDESSYEKQLEKLVLAEGEQWQPYENLGKIYLKRGDIKQSLDTYLKYPGFKPGSTEGRIVLSNYASEVASEFFWKGYRDEASVMYKKSLSYSTGAEGEYQAKIRLAIMNNEYVGATKDSLARANRYNSIYGFRDYISFLHVLGYSDQAWSAFSALTDRFESPHLWSSAFIGHRKQQMTENQLIDWLKQPSINTKKDPFFSKASRYAFMALSLDRAPSKKIYKIVNELNKGYESTIIGENLRKNSKLNDSYSVQNIKKGFMGPSRYKNERWIDLKGDKPGKKLDSELALFSTAYEYLKEKNYKAAMKAFEERGKYYTYNRSDRGGYAMPYFAWASHKTGNTNDFVKLFDSKNRPRLRMNDTALEEMDFYILLSRAMLKGGEAKHEEAIQLLKDAFHTRIFTNSKPIFTWYQILELTEWLYLDSKNEEYRKLLIKWAKDYQLIQPMYSWAYSFEAKYTDNKSDRLRALAMTLYLDKYSIRISHFSKDEKTKAEKWLKENNIFLISNTTAQEAA